MRKKLIEVMRKKIFLHLTGYSAIIIIGVCLFGVGLSSICDYIWFSGDGDITKMIGSTRMSFVASCGMMFSGLALFLTGKYLIRHDKIIGKV